MNSSEIRHRSFEIANRIAEMQYQAEVRRLDSQRAQDPTLNLNYPLYPSLDEIKTISNGIVQYIDPTLAS